MSSGRSLVLAILPTTCQHLTGTDRSRIMFTVHWCLLSMCLSHGSLLASFSSKVPRGPEHPLPVADDDALVARPRQGDVKTVRALQEARRVGPGEGDQHDVGFVSLGNGLRCTTRCGRWRRFFWPRAK